MAKKPAKVKAEVTATAAIEKAAESSAKVIGVRGPKGVELTAAVTLLASGNPKREGSKAADRFAGYVDGMSVQEALDAGLTTADLVYDAAHGHIAVEGYNPALVVKKEKAPKAEKATKAPRAKKVKSVEEVAAESELDAVTAEETID
jgi:hypothetical protein